MTRLKATSHAQPDLFEPQPRLPEGLLYRDDVLSPTEERELVAQFESLTFKPFEFRGYLGRRRVVSYGWRYDFSGSALSRVEEMPPFLLGVREKAAAFAGLAPDAFEHALLTEYPPLAEIGWHKDRPEFGDVVGVSLLSSCTLRFRRKRGTGWERASLEAMPRSAYLLRGPVRTEWQHSIPAVPALRYSITFRTLRGGLPP
jgi:alkylated DNA repair dioxygenase AlkB